MIGKFRGKTLKGFHDNVGILRKERFMLLSLPAHRPSRNAQVLPSLLSVDLSFKTILICLVRKKKIERKAK